MPPRTVEETPRFGEEGTGHIMQEEQMREALNNTGKVRQPAMQTRNTISTMTIPFAIIHSQLSSTRNNRGAWPRPDSQSGFTVGFSQHAIYD